MAQVFAGRDALAWHEGGDDFGVTPSALGTIAADGVSILIGNTQLAHFTSPEGNLCLGQGITTTGVYEKIRAYDSSAVVGSITMQNADGGPGPGGGAAFNLDVNDAPGSGASQLVNYNRFGGAFTSECHLHSDMTAGMRIRTNPATPIMFDTNSVERGRFTATGTLVIGSTTLTGTADCLELDGAGSTSATRTMEVFDSLGAPYFILRDDGRMGVGAGIAGLAATFVCTGQARAVDFSATQPGTPGDPAYSFTQAGNTDTGMYSGGVDELNFTTAGVERVTITPAGLLGINAPTPGSTLTVEGSQAVSVTNVTAGTTTLGDTHYAIFADCTAGTCVVRLPTTATPANRDRVYVIKKVDASANPVNIQTPVGIALDGVIGITPLTVQYQSMTVCAGTNADWFII